jgi:TusE/DsrC/DsvC family sulfur relay protein
MADAMAPLKVCVLQPTSQARGMAGKLIDGVEAIDYAGFVDLVAEHTQQPELALRPHRIPPKETTPWASKSTAPPIETDEEGYLVNLSDWNEDIANEIAKGENVEMTPSHWEVVNFLRQYYDEYQIAPAVRVLTKAIGKQLGEEKGNSKYLYELFPYGPAKQACKIAGLPKPTGCV